MKPVARPTTRIASRATALDPTKDGAVGNTGPLQALRSNYSRHACMRAEYPEGYEPKRTTRVMIPLPHLKPRLGELAAYLDSLE